MKRIASVAALFVLLAAGGLGMAGLAYRPELAIPAGLASRDVEVAGIPLRVLQEGKGRDILMIHGSPGMLEDFDEQAARLRDAFRITRYDRPGQGFSGDGGRYSVSYNADVALALAEKLGLEHAIVVGHSFGGAIGLAMAERSSPRVDAVVVLDSAVYRTIRPVKPVYSFLRLPLVGIGLARLLPASAIQRTAREQMTQEFRAGPPPPSFLSPARLDVLATPKVLHAIANEHVSYNDDLAAQSPGYASIGIPVYVVAQRDDPERRATAERLHTEIARGELLLVSPSGHFVQVEQADAVTDLIRRAAQAE